VVAELLLYGSFVCVAFCGHTPRSRKIADHVEGALETEQITQKAAGVDMGLSPRDATELSKQLAGVRPLNLWRLANLPDAFWIAFAKRILASFGYIVLAPQEREFILSAAQLGAKRMAMIAPGIFTRKQASQ
jgi:hypothetical protein